MLGRFSLAVILGVGVQAGAAIPAGAQEDDRQAVLYQSARNKIGLLRWCRDKGFLGQITAERAIDAIDAGARRIPVNAALKDRGDNAEEIGTAGFWVANGQRELSSVAELFGTTTEALCRELAGQTRKLQSAAKPAQPAEPAPGGEALALPPGAAPATVAVIQPIIPAPAIMPPMPARSPLQRAPKPQTAAVPAPVQPTAYAEKVPVADAAPPAAGEPIPWWRAPFEYKKWRFNRKERPWVP